MSTFIRTHACILLILLSATTALAQSDSYREPPGGFYPPVPPWPPEMFFSYHHASTALEGALRGMAALRHADGNYLLSASQAAILREQARWLALENRQRWIEYRIGLRLWREFERQVRLAEKRRHNEASRASKYAVYSLGSDQLDPITGQITWPAPLQAAEFSDERRRLEELFRDEVHYGASARSTRAEIVRCVTRLSANMRRARTTFDRDSCLAAQRFLCGLKYHDVPASRS